MERLDTQFEAMEGTNCYCCPESAATIRKEIAPLPAHAVHFIGTGDYHYISLFWLEKLEEPFSLVLYDNHPDDQETAFDAGLLSCGSWVARARELSCCRNVWWNRLPPEDDALPVYVSIDLDVLSEEFAHTDWDQGGMRLANLIEAMRTLACNRRILGVDICGGLSINKGASPEDISLNESTGEALYSVFRSLT